MVGLLRSPVFQDQPHLGLDHGRKEAEIQTIEQYEISSDRREVYLHHASDLAEKTDPGFMRTKNPSLAGSVPITHGNALPLESLITEPLPDLPDGGDPSVENLSGTSNEMFHYAERQKTLLNADSVVFHTVKQIDGPLVGLEKFPARRVLQYISPVPESLQYGLRLTHLPKTAPP